MLAPAMDEDMWRHPATQKNIAAVIAYGNKVIPGPAKRDQYQGEADAQFWNGKPGRI
jgi:phosphopantothenoylcysteine decarboxylase/phosphopantothenate--cysteine ligase